MNWEDYLIPLSLYLRIFKEYRRILWTVCQRLTNGGCKVITPITKARGQKKLQPEQHQFSKAVSQIR